MTALVPQVKRRSIARIVLPLILLGTLLPLAFLGWRDLYANILENRKPLIDLIEAPRGGIGVAPVRLRFTVTDTLSGLSELIVVLESKDLTRELVKRTLSGKSSLEQRIEFNGPASGIPEGLYTLSIAARDASLWSNQALTQISLRVDYSKPKVEIVSAGESVRLGGSSLVFYKATDANLAASGVRAGNRTFYGFPAKGVDKSFEDPNLFASLYSVDPQLSPSEVKPRVFAEDDVGNATSTPLATTVLKRAFGTVNRSIDDMTVRDLISPVVDFNLEALQRRSQTAGAQIIFHSERNTEARELEKVQVFLTHLRALNDEHLVSTFSNAPRFERAWEDAFVRQTGRVISSFGDMLVVSDPRGSRTSLSGSWVELALPAEQRDVYAANHGTVIFSESMGFYGKMVAIDHGLGLISLYSNLRSVLVNPGETVSKHQAIGDVGHSGFGDPGSLVYQMYVQSIPVDPAEWWDSVWYQQMIASQVDRVKRAYNIRVLRPLR